MEVLGVTVTFWSVLAALGAVFFTSIIYDWVALLYFRRKYKLKGPFPLPLFGNLLAAFIGPAQGREKKAIELYGKVYFGTAGSLRMINVADVDLLKKILIKDHLKFQNRMTIDGFDPPPIDHGLLQLKDAHWKRVRNIVTPTFSVAKLKLMTSEMNYCAGLLIDGLLRKAETGEPVESQKHFGCFTMDTIASTAFGLRTDSYNNPDDHFISSAKKVFGQEVLGSPVMLLTLLFPRLTTLTKLFNITVYWPLDSVRYFSDVIKHLVQKRKESNDTTRTDLLQLMMNAELQGDEEGVEPSNKKLTLEEILAQGFLVFIAGYDTTNTLLTFLSYELATHPDIQDKLIEEVDQLVPKMGDVKYEVVMEMPYLDQVISETLRMYPPLVKMNRTTSNDQDVEIDGHWFPAGVGVQYSIFQIHRNEDFYPEPDKFKPERFSPEEKKKRDPFVFIPFGNGPRNCIGMRMALLEAKIATVCMLRCLKFVRCPDTEEILELRTDSFLRAKQPIKVGIERR